MGPTASGKTKLALNLAQHINAEIISVDSALIYRDLNIGSAKPTIAELALIPHHLIDIKYPTENYSVADFLLNSKKLINIIHARGRRVILVGGTMMYFNCIFKGISPLPVANQSIRMTLELERQQFGLDYLYEQLLIIDNISAIKIKAQDEQRIFRALEVYRITGITMTELQQQQLISHFNPQQLLSFAFLPPDRRLLQQKIELRFKQMLNQGFENELRVLKIKYPTLKIIHNSMRTIGYYQMWRYLEGEISYNQMSEMTIIATRQLAKRQMTWLRSLIDKFIVLDNPELNEQELLIKILAHLHH